MNGTRSLLGCRSTAVAAPDSNSASKYSFSRSNPALCAGDRTAPAGAGGGATLGTLSAAASAGRAASAHTLTISDGIDPSCQDRRLRHWYLHLMSRQVSGTSGGVVTCRSPLEGACTVSGAESRGLSHSLDVLSASSLSMLTQAASKSQCALSLETPGGSTINCSKDCAIAVAMELKLNHLDPTLGSAKRELVK